MSAWEERMAERVKSRAEKGRCEHGLTIGESSLHGIAWSGGVGLCECHQARFGYIDFMSYTADGEKGWENDPNLCPDCGGQARRVLVGRGCDVVGTMDNTSGLYSVTRHEWWTDESGEVHEKTSDLGNWETSNWPDGPHDCPAGFDD